MCVIGQPEFIKEIIGYTVLLFKDEEYTSVYAGLPHQIGQREEAIDADNPSVPSIRKGLLAKIDYKAGFHGFWSCYDAREFLDTVFVSPQWGAVILEAKFEDIYLKGTYCNLPCFVAQYRTLLKECPLSWRY